MLESTLKGTKPAVMYELTMPRLNVFQGSVLDNVVRDANRFMEEMQRRMRWRGGAMNLQQLQDGGYVVSIAWEELVEVRWIDVETRAVLERATPDELLESSREQQGGE